MPLVLSSKCLERRKQSPDHFSDTYIVVADRLPLCLEICPSSRPVRNTWNKYSLINWHKNVSDRFKVCGVVEECGLGNWMWGGGGRWIDNNSAKNCNLLSPRLTNYPHLSFVALLHQIPASLSILSHHRLSPILSPILTPSSSPIISQRKLFSIFRNTKNQIHLTAAAVLSMESIFGELKIRKRLTSRRMVGHLKSGLTHREFVKALLVVGLGDMRNCSVPRQGTKEGPNPESNNG